jgi:diguanylate cyclase (GGDEF)-like protein
MGVFSGWFDPSSFAPHGFCLSWAPGLLELHAVSDAVTGVCYMAVGFLIFQFGRRRPDMGSAALFNALFVVFFLCGLTHIVDIVVLWRPVYVEQGLLKAVTAAASLPALIILIRLVPKAIGLPSSAQMAEVSREANFDPLTDLPNRRHLIHKLERIIEKASEERRQLAVLFVDLDHFKPVNDTLGHQIGDRLLVEVAVRLKSCVRGSDVVARLGGDEFLVVLEAVSSPESTAMVADNIITAIGLPYTIEDQQIEIGASIGVAVFPGDGTDPDTLIQQADKAMYAAKANGRGGFSNATAAGASL